MIQVLEGEEADVRERYETIEHDHRHHRAIVLLEEHIEQRAFPDWSMGFKRLSHATLDKLSHSNGQLDKGSPDLNLNRKTVEILLNNFHQIVG